MANICTSYLFVSGSEEHVKQFLEAAAEISLLPLSQGKAGRVFSFGKLVAPPPDADRKWCTENWGCQYEPGTQELVFSGSMLRGDFMAIYTMNTDWAPPVKVIRSASAQHPELLFVMDYEEDSYCGRCRFKAGEGADVTLDRQWPRQEFIYNGGY